MYEGVRRELVNYRFHEITIIQPSGEVFLATVKYRGGKVCEDLRSRKTRFAALRKAKEHVDWRVSHIGEGRIFVGLKEHI